MRERVVVKWGGGLITEKAELKTANHSVIDRLAAELTEVVNNGIDVVLVHGAGSFGHLKAKQYRLAEGRTEEEIEGPMTQDLAVTAFRYFIFLLFSHLIPSLTSHFISPLRFPPPVSVLVSFLAFLSTFFLFFRACSSVHTS